MPIPKNDLPNDIEYEKYVSDSGTSPGYEASVTIKYTALQRKQFRKPVNGGYVIVANALMFLDARNSTIDGVPVTNDLFVENSRITLNGKQYLEKDVETLDYERERGIHHWELMLL